MGSKSKKAKLLTRAQRVAAYNQIITKSKAKFKAGQSMTRRQFVKFFSISGIVHKGAYDDVQRSNLRLVQAQNEINSLMRENGLYMSSRNYYGEFYVRDKGCTKAVVKRMSAQTDVHEHHTERLLARMEHRVNAGTWGTYNKVQKTSGVSQSVRRNNVNARLKFV